MPYIKLLTALAGLALLTACGGTAKTADNAGKSANPCIENPFGATCSADDSTIISLRQSVCLADTTINPACTGEAGIATVFCKANPFNTSKACVADTGAIRQRQNQCLDNANINLTCGAVIANFCKTNPFQESACLPNDTYLPARIADCITGGKADSGNCGLITLDTAKNTMITACLENPFDVACESVPDFMSSFAEARTNRASFCDDSMNVADDLCMGDVVMPICGLDPFNAICFTGNTYLSPRVADCIKTENTEAEKCNTLLSDTAMNTELTDCLTNPFKTACQSVSAFMSSFADARVNRESFCDMAGNNTKALCMGENLMGVCDIDSFNASCFADATYLPARLGECIKTENTEDMRCNTLLSDSTMNTAITACLTNPFSDTCEADSDFMTYAETAQTNRASFCGMAGNDTNALCMGAILMEVCGINPFNVLCIMNTAYLTNRQTHCVAGATHTTCPTILSGLSSVVDPTDITGHADLPATPALARAGSNSDSYFISVGADGVIDTTGLIISSENLIEPTPVTLRRASDTMDGVTYTTGSFKSFVALLPSTNLGAPLSIEPTAAWQGHYYLGVFAATHPIPFTIRFNTGTTAGTITATDTQSVYTTEFDLDFTAEGVITGTVGVSFGGEPDIAEARGLIGTEGLVGGFANTDGVGSLDDQVFGGFVADNPPPDPCIAAETCVNTANWLGSFEGANALDTAADITASGKGNQFLQGTATGLTLTGLTTTASPNLTISTPSGGDDTPAVAFGEGTLGGVVYRYAGLLSGVNLGAPITETTFGGQASAMWSGQFTARGAGATTNQAFNLEISFTNATIEAFVRPPHDSIDNEYYLITGSYDRATGVITGRGTNPVTLAHFGVSNNVVNRNAIGNQKYGTLTGLIGSDGAVGAFIGNGFSGGFVAQPE